MKTKKGKKTITKTETETGFLLYGFRSVKTKKKTTTTITTNSDLHYKVQKIKQTTNKRKQNKQTNKCYLCPIRIEKKTLIDIMPGKNNILGNIRIALRLV